MNRLGQAARKKTEDNKVEEDCTLSLSKYDDVFDLDFAMPLWRRCGVRVKRGANKRNILSTLQNLLETDRINKMGRGTSDRVDKLK